MIYRVPQLIVRKIEMLQCKECQNSCKHQEERQNQDILKFIVNIEFATKKVINKFCYSPVAGMGFSALEVVVKFASIHGVHDPFIPVELRENESLVYIVTRSDPIRYRKQSCHELRSNNEARKEIVETDKYTGQNLGRWHAADTAHEGLAKVGVYRKVESKNPLETAKGKNK